jgi:hypothetical protein
MARNYSKVLLNGSILGGRLVSPNISNISISILRQIADMGVSLVPLSKGFSLDSPICSIVIKTHETSTENVFACDRVSVLNPAPDSI